MANLFRSLINRRSDEITRLTTQDYLRLVSNAWNGLVQPMYPSTSTYSRGGKPAERIENSFTGYVYGAYKVNPIVYGLMTRRSSVFSEARFMWREILDGKPGDLFWNDALNVLSKPWPNGTTGELLTRMIQDVDLAGNCYVVNEGNRLRRLRPDWVQIILSGNPLTDPDVDVVGYTFTPGGPDAGEPVAYMPDEVCHWSPIPDPDAQYRGMSWLTPVVREIQGDQAATSHKLAFYRNGATLGPIVRLPKEMTPEQFKKFIQADKEAHAGAENAYSTMYIGGGADVTLAAANMQQLDFKAVQGAGETRLCVASGVPAVIAGVSEGLSGSSLNAGNYGTAKRSFADGTLRTLWRSACAALSTILEVPDSAELWYDESHIAFLREDQQDQAQIDQTTMATIVSGIAGGFEPATVVLTVRPQWSKSLQHSGLMSVQLTPPDSDPNATIDGGGDVPPPDDGVPPDQARSLSDLDEEFYEVLWALDEIIERAYNPDQARIGKGHVGGGRFGSKITPLLEKWLASGGVGDPLGEAGVSRQTIVKAAKEHGVTVPPRMPLTALKAALYAAVHERAVAHTGGSLHPEVTAHQAHVRRIDAARPLAELAHDIDAASTLDEPHRSDVMREHITGAEQAGELTSAQADKLRGMLHGDSAEVRQVEVENRIRAAYRELPKAPGGWVGLADLRHAIGGDASREEIDAALWRLSRQKGVRLDPFDNTRALSAQDRAAALRHPQHPETTVPLHMIAMDGDAASPAPLPTSPTGASKVKAAVGRMAKAQGVTLIGGQNKTANFDPNLHIPLLHNTAADSIPEGTRVRVTHQGWALDGQTVEKAKVEPLVRTRRAPAKKAALAAPAGGAPGRASDQLPDEGPVDYANRKRLEGILAPLEQASSRDEALANLSAASPADLRWAAGQLGIDMHAQSVMNGPRDRTITPAEIAQHIVADFVFNGGGARLGWPGHEGRGGRTGVSLPEVPVADKPRTSSPDWTTEIAARTAELQKQGLNFGAAVAQARREAGVPESPASPIGKAAQTDTGGRIGREEAGRLMHGDQGYLAKVAKKTPARKVAPAKAAKAAKKSAGADPLVLHSGVDVVFDRNEYATKYGRGPYPPSEPFSFNDPSLGYSRDREARHQAETVAKAWDVTPEDFAALVRIAGDGPVHGATLEERKADFLEPKMRAWGRSGGGRVGIPAIIATLGGDTSGLSAAEKEAFDAVQADPAAYRAAAGVGRAVYDGTQAWFAERGITSVRAFRGTKGVERDDARPWTSWSLSQTQTKPERYLGNDYGSDAAKQYQNDLRIKDIPVEQVWSIPPAGFGTYDEEELVVLRHPPSAPDASPASPVGKAPAKAAKKAAKAVDPGMAQERAARERLAESQRLAAVGTAVSEIHGLVDDGTAPAALRNRIETRQRIAEQAGHPGLDTSRLLPLADNPQALLAEADRQASAAGLQRLNAPGDIVAMDHTAGHQSIGEHIPAGTLVRVARPGHTATTSDGRRVGASPTLVEAATPEEIAAHKATQAPKKAAKATAPAKKAVPAAPSLTPELGAPGTGRRAVEDLYPPAGVAAQQHGAFSTRQDTRMAAADLARPVAETLADLGEISYKGASERAMLHRLESARKRGVPGSVIDELSAAVRTGDHNAVAQARADVARRLHMTARPAEAGAVVPHDPTSTHHRVLGEQHLPAGTPVEVYRPGYDWEISPGDRVPLVDGKVDKAPAPSLTPVKGADLPSGPAVQPAPAANTVGGRIVTITRQNADVPIQLPNNGNDQGLVHLDSAVGRLWLDLYHDQRPSNSYLNRIAQLGDNLGAGNVDLQDDVLPALRQLKADAPDTAVADRVQRAIDAIDAPPAQVPDLPDNVPPAVRAWLDQLAHIPTARKTGRFGTGYVDTSVLDKRIAAVRTLSTPGTSRMERDRAERELKARDLHESVDGAGQMWRLTEQTFTPQRVVGYTTGPDGKPVPIEESNPDWPAIRDWLRGKPSPGGGAGPGSTPSAVRSSALDDLAEDPSLDEIRSMAAEDDAIRAAGHDVTPGHDELHHYWVEGKGRHLWVDSPTPWRTLFALVTKAVEEHDRKVPPEVIKTWVSRWFIEAKGYAAGSDKNRVAHGHPPRGHKVGPG